MPDATVDVYANGKQLLKNFAPGTLTGPVSLPAGPYDLKVTAAGAGAGGDALIRADASKSRPARTSPSSPTSPPPGSRC